MDVRAGIAAVVPLLLLAGCSTAPPPAPTSSPGVPTPPAALPSPPPAPLPPTPRTTPPGHLDAARCTTAQLRLSSGGEVSPGTGQNPVALALTNVSARGCHLLGYPGVALVDAQGAVLPLRYLWHGDQMVTSAAPTWVDLAPGATAYVTINKYRCDTAHDAHAVTVRLIPPDDTAPLSLALDRPAMDDCGPGDPGSTLAISPVEPSLGATSPVHG